MMGTSRKGPYGRKTATATTTRKSKICPLRSWVFRFDTFVCRPLWNNDVNWSNFTFRTIWNNSFTSQIRWTFHLERPSRCYRCLWVLLLRPYLTLSLCARLLQILCMVGVVISESSRFGLPRKWVGSKLYVIFVLHLHPTSLHSTLLWLSFFPAYFRQPFLIIN